MVVRWIGSYFDFRHDLRGGAALADDYPTRPIKIIVPFGAGGITDLYAREIASRLEPSLGQPVVVEDRPGQGGSFGAAFGRPRSAGRIHFIDRQQCKYFRTDTLP